MFGFRRQYDFTILESGGECRVTLKTDGDGDKDRQRIFQMFTLLESVMKAAY